MSRHPNNPNLTLHCDPSYKGLSVYTARGPLVAEYLERAKHVVESALQQYGRVFAFRVDLRFPVGMDVLCVNSNHVIERFVASFKAKIRHNRGKARESNPYAHDSTVRYVWCREMGVHDVPHYHMAILLNNDAFCTLGKYELGRHNLFNRLNEAWASALGLSASCALGLVELPDNPFYLLRRDTPVSITPFFYRISYLCKSDTKVFGDWVHAFGASRI